MVRYLPRIVEDEIADLRTGGVSAIAIDGAKGVGKTVSASRFTDRRYLLDQPDDLERFLASPHGAVSGPGAILIDEWQRYPPSWDLVRRAVDSSASTASFVLTGSASDPTANVHSGAGRIVSVRMRPLSLAERGFDAAVSLTAMLDSRQPTLDAESTVELATYAEEIIRGGLPGLRGLTGRALRSQLDGYLARIVDRDVPEGGLNVRQPDKLRRWLGAYAGATSTTASYETIRDAASPGEGEKVNRATALTYQSILERIWVLDPVPAWVGATTQVLHNLGQAPKHHLVDPALAARTLGLTSDALVEGPSFRYFGPLLESLVALNLRVYAQAAEATVRHLRVHRGTHEVDFIVERADGRVVAVEVKAAAVIGDDDVRHLRWLKDNLGSRLADAAILTTGQYAYRRTDGIAVIPVALLGP